MISGISRQPILLTTFCSVIAAPSSAAAAVVMVIVSSGIYFLFRVAQAGPSQPLRDGMKIQRAAGLGDLARHVMSDQSGQSPRQLDQRVEVNSCRQADLVAEIDQVFRTDVAGRA